MGRPMCLMLGLVCVLMAVVRTGAAQQTASPGPQHAFLQEHAGTWDCVLKAGSEESKGVLVTQMVAGGLWLSSHFTGDIGGTAFEGRGLDGYDLDLKKYVSVWVDSMSSGLMTFQGTYDEKTKTLTMTGTGKGPDGLPAQYKTTTRYPDRDHEVFQMFLLGANGSETLMMTAEYTRRK